MTSQRLSRLAFFLLVLAGGRLAAEPLKQPEPPQGFTDSARVVVIEVPVEVTVQGTPLRGLEAEQFRLRVDGENQRLLGFEEVELGQRADAPVLLEQASPRLTEPPSTGCCWFRPFLLLALRGQPLAGGAAELLTQLAPSDLVGVATFGRSRSFELH